MILASLAFVSILQAPIKLDGTYEYRIRESGQKKAKAQDPKTTPPGQIRRLVIEGKRWLLFDMMSGFDGTLKVTRTVVKLTAVNGPVGKLKKLDVLIFDLSKDGKTLTQRVKKASDFQMVFVRTSDKPIVSVPKN